MVVAMLISLPTLSNHQATEPVNDQVKNQTIRFAVVGYPPYTIINDQQASGVDLDILHKLADAIDYKVVLIKCQWKRCLKLVELGQLDMLSTATYTKQHSEYKGFIQLEYLQTPIVFFSQKDTNVSI